MNYNNQILEANGIETVACVNTKQVEKIIMLDIAKLTDQPAKSFIKRNLLSYYVVINTWLLQVQQVSNDAMLCLRLSICKRGLVSAIRSCSEAADSIIHGTSIECDAEASSYISMMRAYASTDAQLLQILRYPKRFCPAGATTIESLSLDAFDAKNAEVKQLNRTEPPYWLIQHIRFYVEKILRTFKFDRNLGYFSSGTTADAGKILCDKIIAFSRENPSYAIPFPNLDIEYAERWRDTLRRRQSVAVVAVPKSYKAARIIAKEPAASQFYLIALGRSLRKAVAESEYHDCCDTTDQSRNQEFARLGSIDGSYATLDLSSASDSISEALERSVFPAGFLRIADYYRCAYIQHGQVRRTMQMAFTSGSGATFDNESILFLAIALTATSLCQNAGMDGVKAPSVYGDDIIVDDRVAETTIDLLHMLGFTVNTDKSFFGHQATGYYRESCGVEYLNGINLTTKYYPRKPVEQDADGIASLVSLEKRLFSCVPARLFLITLIRNLEPRMTSHIVGSDCSDMWEDFPVYKSVTRRCGVEEFELEKHLVLSNSVNEKKGSSHEPVFSQSMLDHWYYIQYLKEGPAYDDELSRLLRVSTSRRQTRRDSFDSKNEWRWVTE